MNKQVGPEMGSLNPPGPVSETEEWKSIIRKYQQSSPWKSAWQIINTLGPYILLWIIMYFAAEISWWWLLPLGLLAGAFLVRIFIIFHDCTHGSFFKSRLANDILGFVTGVLTFTPYHHWKWEHSLHHSTAGDLDRRGIGDVWTLTVQEYLEAPLWKRWGYRFTRNPFVLFILAPLTLFLILHRIPARDAKRRERYWVHATTGTLGLLAIGLACLFGPLCYLLIQLIVLLVASTAGVWLFYVQHQFENAYWERKGEWNFVQAALQGSSFYKLPRILQWFSGNIGFHHIHHLSPRIPNYLLERAQNSEPLFQAVKPLTLKASLKSLSFRLWDESTGKLVGFGGLRKSPSLPSDRDII